MSKVITVDEKYCVCEIAKRSNRSDIPCLFETNEQFNYQNRTCFLFEKELEVANINRGKRYVHVRGLRLDECKKAAPNNTITIELS